jgi:hypothetical protein
MFTNFRSTMTGIDDGTYRLNSKFKCAPLLRPQLERKKSNVSDWPNRPMADSRRWTY